MRRLPAETGADPDAAERGPWQRITAAEADAALRDGECGVRVHDDGEQLRLVGRRGRGVPLGSAPTWADLFGGMVRSRATRGRYDLRWLRGLNRWFPAPESSTADEFAAALGADPVLRMHCAATVPCGPPEPAHPAFPGGTVAVGLDELLRDGAGLLQLVVENRFDRRERALGYFLDHLVRPAVRAFRLALEHHRTALFAAAPPGFELSPELGATGRVLALGAVRNPDPADLAAAGRNLVGALDELGEGCERLGFPDSGGESARAGIERVLGEELRDLRPATARRLARSPQLRPHAHAVPSEQDELLRHVLKEIQERTRKRRWDRSVPQPAVLIDLDLCGIVPRQRAIEAARAIAGPRAGAPEGIPELAAPERLPVLPTAPESGWHTFLELTGLAQRYPQVDWRAVHAEFARAFARSRALRTDEANTGLARFVWDVQDAGGRAVLCTGRGERLREHTEAVLSAAGVPDAALLHMPDDRTRPVPELIARRLRELGELDVVAVFDALHDNRTALSKEFPDALSIAVAIPGLAAEHRPDQPTPDRAPAISTFETAPRPPARPQPRLSHAHSLEELQIGALRGDRAAAQWAVHLDRDESLDLVRAVLADADRAADRAAASARSAAGLDEPCADPDERIDRQARALRHVLTSKQFRKGARSNYQVEHVRRDAEPFLRRGEPIDVVLLGFPVKQCLNGLKAAGPLPDLAELGGLVRLREMQRAVRAVHPAGLRFRILTDGRHFRPRPRSLTGAYVRKLQEYAELAGIADAAVFEEVDAAAARRLAVDVPAVRPRREAHYRGLLADALRGLDITDNPLRTLAEARARASDVDESVSAAVALLPEMLMSLVFSVPLPVPPGAERGGWARQVYADVYDLTGSRVPAAIRRARAEVLRRAWRTVLRYLAIMCVDQELGYEEMFPNRIRLTVSAAMSGRCGFTYLGGSGLLPWQGTGALDERGTVAIDFAVSLQDQGFVPVYSPLVGPRQPWFAVPAGATAPERGGARLDPELLARAHLRRK